MTILTKAVTEKKFDRLDDEPLINNEVNESMTAEKPPKLVSVSIPSPASVPAHVYLARPRARRLSTVTTICACVTAILVLIAGVIGGVCLYQQLAATQIHCIRVSCKVPFPQKLSTVYAGGNHHFVSAKQTGHQDYHDHMIDGDSLDDKTVPRVRCAGDIHVVSAKLTGQQDYHDHVLDAKQKTSDDKDALQRGFKKIPFKGFEQMGNPNYDDSVTDVDPFDDAAWPIVRNDPGIRWSFFDQWFEIDIENKQYEEMTVPDFSGGRRGRFIHDFSSNKTGIVDLDGRRCFVMPLNRSLVLPPQSLFDLVLKMKAGYYEVDTAVVRETMLIVYPKITDYKSVGYYIARECSSLNTYMLKRMPKSRRRMGKRSVEEDEQGMVFTEFAGQKLLQFTIVDDEAAKA